jgi:NDP-sugar pyrophosphorylase family protein
LGLSLVERLLFAIREAGIQEAVIIGSSEIESIKEILKPDEKYKVKIKYIKREREIASLLLKIKEEIKEGFLLLNENVLCHPEILKKTPHALSGRHTG